MSASAEAVEALVERTVGFLPKDSVGWLYVARGFYKLENHHLAAEALAHCLRHEKTRKEAQHLLAFSLLKTGQYEAALAAFEQSVDLGNESDWQPLVELLVDHPALGGALAEGSPAAAGP